MTATTTATAEFLPSSFRFSHPYLPGMADEASANPESDVAVSGERAKAA
jgi:hypothetical protein